MSPHENRSENTPRKEAAALYATYARFDHLPFPARMRAIAEHVRSLDDHDYRADHAALDSGGPDARHLGLFLAVARRDLDAVAAALDDPLLRRRALAAAIRLPVPESALAQLALSRIRAVRHDTYRVLRLSRRRELADRLLPQVRARRGDSEAARLLPACTAGTAGEWLPRLDAPAGVLGSLARTAPLAVAEHLAGAYEELGDAQQRYAHRRRNARLVSTIAERDPDAALLLAERAPGLMTERATAAAMRRPRALLSAVRRGGTGEQLPLAAGPLPRGVLRALRPLAPDELAALADVCRQGSVRYRGGMYPVADPLLALVPPQDRLRLVRERMPVGRGAAYTPVRAVAALEPHHRAEIIRPYLEREGRSGFVRARLGSLLPLPEAEPLLRAMTEAHRVHQRALAWPALLAAAHHHGDPAEYRRVVASCERAWHDQYSVREAALAQAAEAPSLLLAAVPYTVLRDAALTTVQSRDSTAHTLKAAERWLRRSVLGAAARGDASRAAAVALLLAEVVADPRWTGGRTPLRVDAPTARAIWTASAPASLRPARLVALAGLLEDHATDLAGLDDLVRRVALEGEDLQEAARAAQVWLADPATREPRCAGLLAAGRSFAGVPRVLWTVAARRTDLVEALLAAGGPGPWVPRVPHALTGRWLPAQRTLLGRHLARVAADEDAPLRQRADAAALLRDAPALGRLVAEAPQPVGAAALTALGELGGAGLGALLEHAATGGVRGRAAMAAIRRMLDALPDREAVALLAPIAGDARAPVGTRKEAARALAALPGEAAFGALLAAWDAPGQHRDVLAVLARALVARIERPGVAERLRPHRPRCAPPSARSPSSAPTARKRSARRLCAPSTGSGAATSSGRSGPSTPTPTPWRHRACGAPPPVRPSRPPWPRCATVTATWRAGTAASPWRRRTRIPSPCPTGSTSPTAPPNRRRASTTWSAPCGIAAPPPRA